MSRSSDTGLGLAEYLTALQAELSTAGAQAKRNDSKFSIDGVTLQVDISYTLVASADSPTSTKPQFWVLGPATQDTKDGNSPVHQTNNN
ncbi:trypco2 family protein [Microvirga sp. GCM10011540]|uniref:trypco2 family protein n=1 Tax=Microvirga sp. GCM10011540 TaxID=3317338 RepID=UPI00361FE297